MLQIAIFIIFSFSIPNPHVCINVYTLPFLGGSNGEIFRNRKGYFSLNVQTMCDSNLKIMDIVARWPGSSHDSTILTQESVLGLKAGSLETI